MAHVGDHDRAAICPTDEQLRVDLAELDWAKELSDDTLTEIIKTAEWVYFQPGEVVVELESEINYVYFLITGRLNATLYDLIGKEVQRDALTRGFAIGLFALGLPDRSHVHAQASEPTTAIRLTLAQLLQLSAKHADLQLALFRLAARVFRRYTMVDRALPKPAVIALVHHSEASRPLTARLARRFNELDEASCIAGDDERWKPDGDIPFRLLDASDRHEELHEILKDWASHKRLFVDVAGAHSPSTLALVLGYADIVFWCVRPQEAQSAIALLGELEKRVPKWRDKVRIVWLLENGAQTVPFVPNLSEIAARDFKLALDDRGADRISLLGLGFERIIHHLRGVQIGLALGGGAARGMAHLGVLNALERHGIYIDMLAGTSAGALTGTLYAGGLSPEEAIHAFKVDLRPSWLFRHLPAGGYLHLLYKYRRNQFDSLLRKYLGRARMEQLLLPMHTISVDLVEGQPVVRVAGDATTSILESINLPPLALPIIASGQAMVDGGLLNNIPADVLAMRGCNFVIASTVTAELEKDLFGIRSNGHSLRAPFLASIQVIMRQTIVQGHKMNSVGVQPADFVIAPNVTAFDISEFSRADEMAVIGEAATDAVAAQLRKMLCRLDPKLFSAS
jgi:NTE family protein